MAYNEAKKRSNQKSDAKYMQILLKPYKAEGEAIKKAAITAGQSTQAYVLQAVSVWNEKKTNKTWRKIQLLF